MEKLSLGMGCFWGVEKLLTSLPGVVSTQVGYQGGHVTNPSYELVCTGTTGHAEVVEVRYDPEVLPTTELLRAFWENHDPTQKDRQGNDVGTQYRSVLVYSTGQQLRDIIVTKADYQKALSGAGYGEITTELLPLADAGAFFRAEEYHQQYLAKNPFGYCPIHATGIKCG